jgi:hypothetical protein
MNFVASGAGLTSRFDSRAGSRGLLHVDTAELEEDPPALVRIDRHPVDPLEVVPEDVRQRLAGEVGGKVRAARGPEPRAVRRGEVPGPDVRRENLVPVQGQDRVGHGRADVTDVGSSDTSGEEGDQQRRGGSQTRDDEQSGAQTGGSRAGRRSRM